MALLVTGSSGFLGRALVPRLIAAGHQIVGLDPAPPPGSDYLHVSDDLGDMGLVMELLRAHEITHVVHAGGISGPMVLSDRPDLVMAINVTGSLNLIRAALETGVKTFVYCSSVSAVGEFYEADPIGISHPMQPVHSYGCSKAAVEMVLRGLWNRVPLDVCALRFTTIYGPGRQTSWVLDEIVSAAFQNRPLSVSPVTDWPYIFIDDAADGVIAACFSASRTELAYYLAYPQQVSLSNIADAAAAAGFPASIEIDHTRPGSARGPLDIGPARRDFGFAPKVDHREGIRRMIAARLGGAA